jgi:hypothetical protein
VHAHRLTSAAITAALVMAACTSDPADRIGSQCGQDAWALAERYFGGDARS